MEDEVAMANNEYYRDALDALYPEDSAHMWEQAKEFEESLGKK